MSESSAKATRAAIQIGELILDGFMLPDGAYRMSQTQAADIIGKPEINARRFLGSKGSKALLGEYYTPDSIEAEGAQGRRGSTRFNALTLEVVTAYWVYECSKGNKQALTLVIALTTESLARRFDTAFGVQRSEDEYNQALTQRIEQLESSLEALGGAYAEPDLLREENERLRQQLRDVGIEPWQLPDSDE
ncbi:hypothetical protein QGP82_23700 [Leptothoe sp. LEGE 181152]|nr:hypothetical protein [Leptothoe sp. LEGE 181152]